MERAQHLRRDRRVLPRFASLASGLAVVLCVVALAKAQTAEVRTWTSGEFTIRAKFVSVTNGTVTLAEPSGDTLEIELAKLSAADQKYVAQQQKLATASPFRKKAASPFKKKSTTPFKAKGMSPGGDEAEAVGEEGASGRLVRPSWAGVQRIGVTPTGSGWKVPVAAVATPATSPKVRPVPIPPKNNFFAGPKGLVLNAGRTRAVVGYAGTTPGANQKGGSQVTLCDLENGKTLGSSSQSGLYAPLALSDDGTQVLMRSDVFGPGGHDRLEFWGVSKAGVVKGDQWVPYEADAGNDRGDRDVRWAAFLDAGRLVTISEKGTLVIWQVSPLKPLATFAAAKGCTPALSPDRKHLAFAVDKSIGVLDLASLEVIALQPAPMPNMVWTSFAFSPTGNRLACKVFVTKVYVYDVAAGALYREVSLQGMNAQNEPVFPGDGHLMLGDHLLFDLENQVRLWLYQGNEHVAVGGDGFCWFEVAAGKDQMGGLIPGKVPPPAAQQALAVAMKDPNFFIVKPGSAVAIDANGIPDPAQRAAVVQSLTANLARVGVTVAPGSPVTVFASLQQDKEQEIAYRSFGRGFAVERFKVRPWISRIQFAFEGKSAWDSSASSMPHFEFTQLKQGESLQDHVRKFEQPNYAYFANAELPKLLTRPTGQGGGALGFATVSLMGIR